MASFNLRHCNILADVRLREQYTQYSVRSRERPDLDNHDREMTKTKPSGDAQMPDALSILRSLASAAARSQTLLAGFAGSRPGADNAHLINAFMALTTRMMANPGKLAQAQFGLWQDQMSLLQHAFGKLWGIKSEAVIEPERDDRRFRHEDWQTNALFDFIKQSYLLTARSIQNTVAGVEGLDDKTAAKVEFYTRQFVDALAPTNFIATNPEVLRATAETGGQNLVSGLKNLLNDLERGDGELKIRMSDPDAFAHGEDIAATPGKVIYQTDLMQLIQYAPATAEVYQRPLLLIPPWINKYYVLDLQPRNSLLKWLVEQGFTVFVISWVNPDERLAAKTFDDYMREGPLAALDAIEQATGESRVNVTGYCLGGTLLGATLAWLAAKQDRRIASGTFLTSMLDFSEPGELGVFIDEAQLESLEATMNARGYLDGAEMAATFNMLRANDLIWSFVIHNYLLGKEPIPFDLLYWNSDSTRMPAAMHSFYLRNMYQKNLLCQAHGLTLDGEAIDLRSVDTPVYFLSAQEDHIAPWKSTYAGALLLNGPVRFVLGESGHIAGVVNPPAADKYGYRTGEQLPASSDEWLVGAQRHTGSWWADWLQWLQPHSGEMVKARTPGDGQLPVLEDAPGAYAKVRNT